jgi:hypothetical protein
VKNLSRVTWIVLCLAAVVPASATGAPILVVNPGFELPASGDNGFSNEEITGWVVDSGTFQLKAGVYNPPAGEITPSEGQNVAYLGPFGQPASSISQVLSVLLAPSTTYTLQVDVGRRAGSPDAGFGLALLAGGTELASVTNSFVLPVGTMDTATLVFVSPDDLGGSGGLLAIRLFNAASFGQTNYDNVRLDASAGPLTVPEPTSLTLLGIGAVLLAGKQYRKEPARRV